MTKQITVRKELLLNLGNFSNEKIIVEITTEDSFENAWKEVNKQLEEQETYERGLRLTVNPSEESKEVKQPF